MTQQHKYGLRLIGTNFFLKEPKEAVLMAQINYNLVPYRNKNSFLTDNLYDVHFYTKLGCINNAIEEGFGYAYPNFWKYGPGYHNRLGRKCSQRISQAILLNGMAKFEIAHVIMQPVVVRADDILNKSTFDKFKQMKERYH